MNRIHARAALATGLALAAAPAGAANWLVLNSAEAPEGAPNMAVFGFIQPTYRNIDDSDTPSEGNPQAGNRPIFNTLSPDRSSSQGFNLARARLGVRGALNNTDEDIHYFVLTEWGNNGITRLADPEGGSHGPQLTDASVTFRHLAGGGSDDIWEPGVSLRIGQFQWPLVDEGLRAIPTYDYISFSEVSRQQVLERYVRANDSDSDLSGFDGAISSYRDIGAMAFDEFRITEHWEGTWAAGLGNGNGINRGDNDDNQDVYLRAQAAYVFDGVHRGSPRREDVKVFAWSQQGDRVFDADGDGTLDSGEEFERNRHGLGFHFYRQPWRLSGEYVFGNGMVYNGTAPPVTNPGEDIGDVAPQMAWGEDNEFDGWYLDAAWFVQPNKLALQARYDVLNRLKEFDGDGQFADEGHPERVFETWTLGLQYWAHPVKSQWTLSYRIRDLEAPHNDVADEIGSTMGNEIALQYFHLFNAGG